jgi:zinc transport system permease protein
MREFLQALTDPGLPFLRYAVVAGLMAGVSFGIVGTYVVVRRISYLAGAIAHCVLGGIGAALWLQRAHGVTWCTPMLGAVAAALVAAVVLGLVSLYARQREDTLIGALWAVGMAVGVLFLARTPGYVDAMSYLFGNILLVSKHDLWIVGMLDALVLALVVTFYPHFFAVCFDGPFAVLRGVRVKLYYLLLLLMTALTVVLLVSIVGIVMVIALLTLPAAIAGHFAQRLWTMMALAAGVSMVFTTAGLAVSYRMEMPSGPVIIVLAAVAYLAVALGRRFARGRQGGGGAA